MERFAGGRSDALLLKILVAGIYASVFLPLIVTSDFLSPFHFGKVVLFRVLVEVLTVLYIALILGAGGRRYLPARSGILVALVAYTAVLGITTATAISSSQSFWGTLERMGGWFTFLHYLGWFVIASGILTRAQWWKLASLSVLASILSTFYGFLQKTDIGWVIASGGRLRIVGTIGNPALFAGYTLVHIFLALALFARAITIRVRWWYISIIILNIIAVFMTGVRGSALALVAGLIIVGLLYQARTIRRAVGGMLLCVAIGAILLGVFRNSSFVQNNPYLARYADFSLQTRTVQSRFTVWKIGIDGWNDSAKTMLIGYGPENFNYPFSFHFNPQLYETAETFFDRAHNSIVELLVTAGLLGLLAYALLGGALAKAIQKLYRNDRNTAAIIAGGLIAYFVHTLFIFDTMANYLVFFLVAGIILAETVERQTMPETTQVRLYTWRVPIVLACALVGLYLVATTAVVPALANYRAGQGILAGRQRDDQRAIEEYAQALASPVSIQYEIRHRFAQYIIDRTNVSGSPTPVLLVDALNKAVDEVRKNQEQYLHDFLPPLYLARLYIMLGKDNPQSPHNDKALESAFASLKLAPQYVRTFFEIGQAYLNKKDYANAEKYFLQARALSPGPTGSVWYLGMFYVARGEVRRGVDLIYESGYYFLSDRGQLLRMIELHIELKEFQKMIPLYINLINIDPTNGQYYASLAVAYAKVGDYQRAIATAQLAAKIDPSLTAEAEAFIRSLPTR